MMKKPFTAGSFAIIYILVAAIIITALMVHLSTHPGMVLTVVALLTILLLVYRMRTTSGFTQTVHIALIVLIAIVSLFIIGLGNGGTQLWFSTLYGVFDLLLILVEVVFLSSREYT